MYKSLIFKISSLVILLLIYISLNAVTPITNDFQKLQSPHYELFNKTTTSIVQDNEVGFIWVGSRNGLFCYNGTEYHEVSAVNKLLSTNLRLHITKLCFDHRGWLWIGTRKGILIYNPGSNQKIEIQNYFKLKNIIVRDFFPLKSGDVLIGSRNHLFTYNFEENKIIDITPEVRMLSERKIPYLFNSFCKENDSSLWVSSSLGLIKYNYKNIDYSDYDFFSFVKDFKTNELFKQTIILKKDPYGNLLLGSNNGLYILDLNTKTLKPYIYTTDKQYNNITALTVDYNNRIWIGTLNGILVTENYQKPTLLSYNPELPNSLSDDRISSIFSDKNENIWIGSLNGGVNFWSKNKASFLHISDKTPNSLSYKTVNSIDKDDEGNIYFGTDKKGISIYNTYSGKFKQLSAKDKVLESLSVNHILTDKENLWIASLSNGLIKYNTKTNIYKKYLIDNKNSVQKHPFRNLILSTAKYSDSVFIVGTFHQGLNKFNAKTGIFSNIPLKSFKSPQKFIPAVQQVTKDNLGNLWVVAEDDLYLLEKNGSFDTGFNITQIYDGNPDNGWINNICITCENGVYFSCPLNSIFRYANSKLSKIDLGEHIKVLSIVEGSNNNLWLSTNRGIINYNCISQTHNIFDENFGLQKNEFIRGAGIYASNGMIYFGGASGVTAFNPTEITKTSNDSLKTTITEFLVYNQKLTTNDNTGILTQPIAFTKALTLNYDQNMFTIKFSYGDFGLINRNNFEYRMVGFNNNWIKTNSPKVTYTLQSGGKYTFEVRYINTNGQPSPKTTQLHVTLLNPLWKTPWAYTLYALIVFSIFWGLFNLYSSKTKLKYQLHIEAIKHEKQKELNEQKLRFFTNISHDFRTPLTLIIGTIEQFVNKFPITSEMHNMLMAAQKNSKQLMNLINDLMEFRKFENKKNSLSVSEKDIVSFTHEIFLSFNNQAKINKYNYSFKSNVDKLLVFFDGSKIERVIYNLLSNAFKYTEQGGNISIEIISESDNAKLIIKDSGCGIDPEHLPNIFNRFYEVKPQSANFLKGVGIGLTIAKHFVELHKGTIKVDSEPDKGSTFTISLRLGNKHFNKEDVIEVQSEIDQLKQSQQELTVNDNQKLRTIIEDVLRKKDKKHTILIAEDDEDLGLFLKDTLCDYFNVQLEANGLKGYQSALNNPPDLIISDVMMPVLNGIDFCYKIKTNIETSHIPFIMLTARTAQVYKYQGLESGADEYLSKPFQIKELLLKCANILKTQENFRQKFLSKDIQDINKFENTDDEYTKALKILNANIDNDAFGVNDLCEKMGLSRSVLYNKVKEWTDQSPGELLLGFRMKRAATLLEQQKYNIAEVANKTGYKQATYFTKCFKNYYKMLPSEYIKKYCK